MPGKYLSPEDRDALFRFFSGQASILRHSEFVRRVGTSRQTWWKFRRRRTCPEKFKRAVAIQWCKALGTELSKQLKSKKHQMRKEQLEEDLSSLCAELEQTSFITAPLRRRLLFALNEVLLADGRTTNLALNEQGDHESRVTVFSTAGAAYDLVFASTLGRAPIPHILILHRGETDLRQPLAEHPINKDTYAKVVGSLRNLIDAYARLKAKSKFDDAVANMIRGQRRHTS